MTTIVPTEYVGLCPDPFHYGEFYVPLSAKEVAEGQIRCPESDCDCDLIVYVNLAHMEVR
jgi:hypothetical protein